MLTQTVSERMGGERFQAETVFEERYLKPLEQKYEFFGEVPDAWKAYKAADKWPSKLEREKPDFWLPDAKELYECVGCKGNVVRIRTSKPGSMMYWCYQLGAKGFFALYHSPSDTGMLIPADKLMEAAFHRRTTIEHLDNDLYVIPLDLLKGGE